MQAAYLGCLALSLLGMALWDYRAKLTFFRDATGALRVMAICVGAFLLWDALGIATGTFFRGDSPYMLGIELAPEMPVEEPVFLVFLTYLAMNLTAAAGKVVNA